MEPSAQQKQMGFYGTSATKPSGSPYSTYPDDAKVYKTGAAAGGIVGWIKVSGVWEEFGVIGVTP